MSSKCSHAIFHRDCPSCVSEWLTTNVDKPFPRSCGHKNRRLGCKYCGTEFESELLNPLNFDEENFSYSKGVTEGGLAKMARAIDDLEKERDMWKFKATIYKHKLEQIHQLTDTNIAGLNGIKTKKQIEDEKFVEGESWGKEEVNGKKTS